MERGETPGHDVAARLSAAVIALAAWTGLGLFFANNLAASGSAILAVVRMSLYFTNICNLGLALLFTCLALGPRAFEARRAVACGALAIMMVGVVYFTMLQGGVSLGDRFAVANTLVHLATPVLTPLHWLLFVRKGALKSVDPLLFTLVPAGYLALAIVRGAVSGIYPYPFLDAAHLGVWGTLLNAAPIAAIFLTAAWVMLSLDRRLAQRSIG